MLLFIAVIDLVINIIGGVILITLSVGLLIYIFFIFTATFAFLRDYLREFVGFIGAVTFLGFLAWATI